jgi:hypothetical protein
MTAPTLIKSTLDLPLLVRGSTISVSAEPVEASHQRPRILSSSKEQRAQPAAICQRSMPA